MATPGPNRPPAPGPPDGCRAGRPTIGTLARKTGVATSALRYWEQLGLLPAPDRVPGQRRYPVSTVDMVGMILLFREVGFTLREIAGLLASRAGGTGEWRDFHRRKLAELDERISHAQVARSALVHGLACPHEDGIFGCPNLAAAVSARLAGHPLREAHAH